MASNTKSSIKNISDLQSVTSGQAVSVRLTVKVINRSSTGWTSTTTGQKLKGIFADSSGFMRFSAFDPAKQDSKLLEGKVLMIKNFTVKDGVVMLGQHSSVCSGGTVAVSAETTRRAESMLKEPANALFTVEQAKTSPVKKHVSIKGNLTLVSNNRTVTNKSSGMEKLVRDITVQDTTGEIKLSLWETAANVSLNVGEDVLVKDSVVTYNTYFKETTLTVGDADDIQMVVCPPKDMVIEVIGVFSTDLVQETVELLVLSKEVEEFVLTVDRKELLDNITLETPEIDSLIKILPIKMSCKMTKTKITKINEVE